ncbi:hypothetical protein [Granulicatella sp. zg-ZJ]|uniref:hypothetical protein n=1 Tax=Granulicatella sp. zg-ZJ TaxID=2678504 RepID=UPI001F084FAE|nr:hypothetical protein [Granulicatella sp. zg-ZJ]
MALSNEESDILDELLQIYDEQYITYKKIGDIQIGIKQDDKLIAGLSATLTTCRIYIPRKFLLMKRIDVKD